jgi:Na+-transporting methylmalonyl-CoA/oxaloacetate decarboxylase gamma subunit
MNKEIIFNALEIMGKGMLSIFVVIFVLTLIVILLSKVTNMKIFKKEENESED